MKRGERKIIRTTSERGIRTYDLLIRSQTLAFFSFSLIN